MKILIVEDDAKLCKTIAKALEMDGYAVETCADGDEGAYFMGTNAFDLVILDRMLPGQDGIRILQQARSLGNGVPVLVLSAMGAVGDRVTGLDAGADDYLGKPFEMAELLARVRALIRRPSPIQQMETLHYGDLSFTPQSQTLLGPKGQEQLSRRESDLLELFMRSDGATITRKTIFWRVWGPAADVEEGNISTYIHFLRRRLVAVCSAGQFQNHRGVGFSLRFPPSTKGG